VEFCQEAQQRSQWSSKRNEGSYIASPRVCEGADKVTNDSQPKADKTLGLDIPATISACVDEVIDERRRLLRCMSPVV
jgi:hypothetical protein